MELGIAHSTFYVCRCHVMVLRFVVVVVGANTALDRLWLKRMEERRILGAPFFPRNFSIIYFEWIFVSGLEHQPQFILIIKSNVSRGMISPWIRFSHIDFVLLPCECASDTVVKSWCQTIKCEKHMSVPCHTCVRSAQLVRCNSTMCVCCWLLVWTMNK